MPYFPMVLRSVLIRLFSFIILPNFPSPYPALPFHHHFQEIGKRSAAKPKAERSQRRWWMADFLISDIKGKP
jgi:hypothetical protein